MDLKGIVSISGMAGLYKVVGQTKNGFIAESLIDKKRVPAYSHYKVSTLEDIRIFSTGEDVPLKDVFQKIADKEKYGPAIDHKAADEEVKKYFSEAFADHDKERVYVSDIRKLINLYNILQKNDLLKTKESEAEVDGDDKSVKVPDEKKKTVTRKPKPKNVGVKAPRNAPAKKTQGVRKTGTA